ncbi:MAG: type II toxin-antitoxin system RelE/ParE family toxin [Gemmataceae bacterium]
MSRTIVVRGAARRDIDDAREWYELQQPGVGREFLDEAQAALIRVRDNPEGYAKGRHGVRHALVHRFPYVVIYRVDATVVVVVAVMHTRRHPRAWRSRL